MAKSKTVYMCKECGNEFPRWQGRCPACGAWNSFSEETKRAKEAAPARKLAPERSTPTPVTQVATVDAARIASGIDEFDRILGGGLVVGSAVLVGGAPGIGKSTLLLQAAKLVAAEYDRPVMYVTSEESVLQTRLRAERLDALDDQLLVLGETDVDAIVSAVKNTRPALAVVDSVQMIYSSEVSSAPGSVTQLRECAARLVYLAKRTGVPVLLVGHVTKGGTIAGPRALEHMVDTVLYFEGDRYHAYRLLRAVKNRFGSTDEVAVFEMRRDGLREVPNPSAVFLSDRGPAGAGSVVVPCVQGSRALLVEVQALISGAGYGVAERKVTGADYNRVCMLQAVLERRVGLQIGGQDTFVNVVGGFRIDEPAADLGIAAAMASSWENFPVPADTVLFGEVGLGGELRAVTYAESRLREAAKLGFKRAVIPRGNRAEYDIPKALKVLPTRSLAAALDAIR